MAEYVQKEKYEGMWNGEPVKFNRVWRGHRFTDEECEALCNGENVEVRGIISPKTGHEYGVSGHLDNLVFTDKESGDTRDYIGFKQDKFLPRPIPDVWCQHAFTQAEKQALEKGDAVSIEDAVSKAGKKFKCRIRYNKDDGNFSFE